MALEEGRNTWTRTLPDEEIVSIGSEERIAPAVSDSVRAQPEGHMPEKEPANKAS